MKLQELNAQEMREINGGLLGLGGSSDSSSTGVISGALGLNFSNESHDEDGSWEKSSFGLGLDLGALLNSISE